MVVGNNQSTCYIPIGLKHRMAGTKPLYQSAIKCQFSMQSTTKLEESSTIQAIQMIDNILIR